MTLPPKIVFTAAVCGLYLISRALPEIPQTHGRIRLNQSGVLGRLNGPGWTASGRLHGLATGRRLKLCTRLRSQVREDLLDHRRSQDCCDYLEQPAAVRAVLHQEHISRIHRKTPDRAVPNLPLLNARRWPTRAIGPAARQQSFIRAAPDSRWLTTRHRSFVRCPRGWLALALAMLRDWRVKHPA